jgi:hypothetical protein
LGKAFSSADGASKANGGGQKSLHSLKMMTQKVMTMQRLERAAKMHHEASTRVNRSNDRQGHHQRARTWLDAIGHGTDDQDTPEDLLLGDGDDFRDFHKVFDADPNTMKERRLEEIYYSSGTDAGDAQLEGQMPNESLPLLGGDIVDRHETIHSELQWQARQIFVKSQFKRFREFFDPVAIASGVGRWFIFSALMLAIPLFVTAWILFYYCGNPSPPEFLPGSATLSWCKYSLKRSVASNFMKKSKWLAFDFHLLFRDQFYW